MSPVFHIFFHGTLVFICFIHLVINRKCKINQILKSLKNACKGVHLIFAVELEFYKFFSNILFTDFIKTLNNFQKLNEDSQKAISFN